MKSKGYVRRIDNFGRIGIPKDLMKVLEFQEGDALEIYITGDKQIILQKYQPTRAEQIEQMFATLNEILSEKPCESTTALAKQMTYKLEKEVAELIYENEDDCDYNDYDFEDDDE